MRIKRQKCYSMGLAEMALMRQAVPGSVRRGIGRAVTAPLRWLWNGTRNWLEKRAAKKSGSILENFKS